MIGFKKEIHIINLEIISKNKSSQKQVEEVTEKEEPKTKLFCETFLMKKLKTKGKFDLNQEYLFNKTENALKELTSGFNRRSECIFSKYQELFRQDSRCEIEDSSKSENSENSKNYERSEKTNPWNQTASEESCKQSLQETNQKKISNFDKSFKADNTNPKSINKCLFNSKKSDQHEKMIINTNRSFENNPNTKKVYHYKSLFS